MEEEISQLRQSGPVGIRRMAEVRSQLRQRAPAPPNCGKAQGPETSEEPNWFKNKDGVKRLELPAIARVIPRVATYTFFRRHGDTYRAARRYWKVTDEPGSLQVILTLPETPHFTLYYKKFRQLAESIDEATDVEWRKVMKKSATHWSDEEKASWLKENAFTANGPRVGPHFAPMMLESVETWVSVYGYQKFLDNVQMLLSNYRPMETWTGVKIPNKEETPKNTSTQKHRHSRAGRAGGEARRTR